MDMPDMEDMAKTPEEKAKGEYGMSMPSCDNDYPYGLSICLTHVELAKLGLDDQCEVGDMVCFCAVARVTSVRTEESETNGKTCRVELQITHMGVDDVEGDADDDDEPGAGESDY